MTPPTTNPRDNHFFKFYVVYMVLAAVIQLIPFLLWGFSGGGPEPNSAFTITLNVGETVVALAALVLSIIALVLFIKRKYPKITWLLPIGYFFVKLAGIIGATVWGIISISKQFESIGNDATPEEIQKLSEQLASQPPFYIVLTALVSAVMIIVLAVVVWFRTKNVASTSGTAFTPSS